jgi:hypothetical protein
MTLKHDCRRPVPEWLARLNPVAMATSDFPSKKALEHSLYYPAAGFDGRSVQFLGGFIHSFVYVDYGEEQSAVDAEIQQPGFLGYHLAASKHLNERDLAPNGWSPQVPSQYRDQMKRFADMRTCGFVRGPFANWYIFDRDGDRAEDHGPLRFSLVYLCADGVAAYHALYWQNHIAPEVLTIIQPGTGFGVTTPISETPRVSSRGPFCKETVSIYRNISYVVGFFSIMRRRFGLRRIQNTSNGFSTRMEMAFGGVERVQTLPEGPSHR